MTYDCEQVRARFDDWLDGALGRGERAPIRSHLEGCDACRRELAAHESLRVETTRLPRELHPARDLWPAIESRLEPPAAVGWWRRSVAVLRGGLEMRSPVAAALAAVLVLALGVWLWRQPSESPPVTVRATAATARGVDPALAARADLARSEDGMLLAHRDLLEAIERQKDNLPPETVAILEENLRIIDEAIGEIRSALEDDPLNPKLQLLLAVHYKQEVQLLKRVSGV